MSIQLPTYEQVVFDDSPLEEVVCQLRFNTILKIAAAPPAVFQDAIRATFPVLVQEHGVQIAMTGAQPMFAATTEPAWQCRTTDGNWIVAITSDFIALKTSAYRDFEHFWKTLAPVVSAFESVYSPPFYTRLGLRYVNRFFNTRDDGKPVAWQEILNSNLSQLFADPVLRDGVAEANHHVILHTDAGTVGWRYSRDIGQADGKPTERFTLDFDHFATGEIAGEDVGTTLARFNDCAYRLFRWCLTEQGYSRLRPRKKVSQDEAEG